MNKQPFLLVSYGFTGFKSFIIDNDKNTINRTLYSMNNINKKDDIGCLSKLESFLTSKT